MASIGTAKELALSRFDKPLSKLQQILASHRTTPEALQALLKEDGRTQAFFLQVLFKFYENEHKTAEQWRSVAKRYEDALGSVVDVADWRAFAEKLPLSMDEKEKITKYLDLDVASRTNAAIAQLNSLKDEEALAAMRDKIESWNWGTYDDDREIILGGMQDHLKSIETQEYDLTILEGQHGIHEFRRDLRQFLIQSQALSGLIALDKRYCPRSEYAHLTKEEIATKPYNILPTNPKERRTCQISQCLYLAVSKLSNDLSDAKEIGQGEEMLFRYYRAQGQSETAARTSAQSRARLHPGYHDYRARAKKLRQEMMHSELLYYVRQDIKACRG